MGRLLHEWKGFDQFLSASSTQRYLKKCYEKLDTSMSIDELSYRNCYSFIYYLTHGKRHFDLCQHSPLELQPVLLYYGMVQLIKCCLLTVDPLYPESTALLAHGVTTRKRKKQNYLFLQDEIKVQRNGLFPYFSEQLFQMEQLEGDKFQMKDLFSYVPELNELSRQISGKEPLLEVEMDRNGKLFTFEDKVLDPLHMTASRFIQFLKQQALPNEVDIRHEGSFFTLEMKEINNKYRQLFRLTLDDKCYIPVTRDGYKPLHEVMVHYLLLYNLSMICRYETEWWGDLFHTFSSNDYPYISRFLSISRLKVPHMLMTYLEEKGMG
ncbi:YaaC family protein [Pseudalkalibacillus sp. SCS-8]|uniref:YaaC family protein n=1 Tax=Pseudalkalibacillus nanhaiensis TaxID=3115291 RepID=UPI0032D9E4F0